MNEMYIHCGLNPQMWIIVGKYHNYIYNNISNYYLSLETLEPLKVHKMVQNNPLWGGGYEKTHMSIVKR